MMYRIRIALGQRWLVRDGSMIVVTADRAEHAIDSRWRWALSNGEMCDEAGQVGMNGPHKSDLIRLAYEDEEGQKGAPGMDSVAAPL